MQETAVPGAEPFVEGLQADSYSILPGRADSGLLLLCDHAGNALPAEYGRLGLPDSEFERHIAYDVGSREITTALSRALGVPAVLTHYSRLLIDPNRGADDPTLIMRLSDGAIIPGNRQLDAAERNKRLRLYYQPYHAAIERVIGQCLGSGVPPALLSLHSFTHVWKGVPRPWHAGVLWDKDDRLAAALLESLYAEADLVVGDNAPYTGRLRGDTMWQHGTMRGLAHAIMEIRQDLIASPEGQAAWAERLTRILVGLLDRPELRLAFRSVRHFGSHSDDPRRRATTNATSDAAAGAMAGASTGASAATRSIGAADAASSTVGAASSATTQVEAAVFRRLLAHLHTRSDISDAALEALAGVGRSGLADWYREAAAHAGLRVSADEARDLIQGHARHQRRTIEDSTDVAENLIAFDAKRARGER